MAELTKKQADALKARGVNPTITPKHVKVSEPIQLSGISEIAQQIQMMAEAQQRSQQILISQLGAIVAAIEEKEIKSTDVSQLTRAVLSLKQEVVTDGNTPVDYRIDFERDQRGLMKPGITFTAVPKVLN